MKLFFLLISIILYTSNCFGQLKNTVYSMMDYHHMNFFSFYSETEGFFLQKFSEDVNITEKYNLYVIFFNYEITKQDKRKYIIIYPLKHFPSPYYILPDSAFVNSKLMNKTAPRGLNDPPRKVYEYSGLFYNLPDTCRLEILDKNTIAQELPAGPMERQLGFVWIYRKK